jgi:hypothetical protein
MKCIFSLNGSRLSRKRKSSRTPTTNGFAKKQGTLVNSNYKGCSYDALSMECDSSQGTIPKATEIGRRESGHFDHPSSIC